MGIMADVMYKIKGVLSKMGIIKKLSSVSKIKDIPVDDGYYNLIDDWFDIYRGYYPKWHDIVIKSIEREKKDRMFSLNMAKVVSQELAMLVFNERCEINISDDKTNEYLQQVLCDNGFSTNTQSYLEFGFATGGFVFKPYFDDGKIRISYITADSFIPLSWNSEGIKEGVFTYETIKGKYRYTHLEWHVWENQGDKKVYVIKNELYKADRKAGDIGIKCALDEMFEDLEPEVYFENIEVPLFVYIKPNTANFIDPKSPLGVPVYAHALDTLRLIDIAYDSFHREFKLGRRRIIVPASAVRTVMNEEGQMVRFFDASDEVYQAMDIGDMDNSKIYDNTVELRIEEHVSAINALLNMLSMQIGFSAGSFSFDGQGVKTATEVVSENSKTFRTKQSHEIIVEDALRKLVDVILVMSDLYGLHSAPEDYDVSATFDDSIAEDKTAETDREINLVLNGLQSKVRALMKIHRITRDEAEELLEEIKEESSSVGADSVDMFGLTRNTPPPQEGEEGQAEGQEEDLNGDNPPPIPPPNI